MQGSPGTYREITASVGFTMKIPASAFPQMLKMVTKSLPYEVPFEPKTSEAKAIVSIIHEIIRIDSNLVELRGFGYHLAAQIDGNPTKRISTKDILHRFVDIIEQYVRESTNELK